MAFWFIRFTRITRWRTTLCHSNRKSTNEEILRNWTVLKAFSTNHKSNYSQWITKRIRRKREKKIVVIALKWKLFHQKFMKCCMFGCMCFVLPHGIFKSVILISHRVKVKSNRVWFIYLCLIAYVIKTVPGTLINISKERSTSRKCHWCILERGNRVGTEFLFFFLIHGA